MNKKYTIDSLLDRSIINTSTRIFDIAYKKGAKKIIFAMTPDTAHSTTLDFCEKAGNNVPLMWLLRHMLDYTDPILETTVMGIPFSNPFGISAGLDKIVRLLK